MSDSKRKLEEALAEVKDAFSQYTVTHPVDGYLIDEDMRYQLEHDTHNMLPQYLYLAVSRWGAENDFKAFLPTILELFTSEKKTPLTYDTFELLRKLHYLKFQQWEQDEVDAVTNVFQAYWQILLDNYEEYKA